MDSDSIERIRSATFAIGRRGYEKREVDHFLSRLADWLEAGGGDRARSDTVKRELERVGQKTGKILADAEETAQQLREEGEHEARETLGQASAQAERTRKEADEYAARTQHAADEYAKKTHAAADRYDDERRRDADAYASGTRAKADEYSDNARAEADHQAVESVKAGEAKAQRIVAEGAKRREDIETVIADLARRRDAVLGQIEKLSGELQAAVDHHRPAAGADPFTPPKDAAKRAPEQTRQGRQQKPRAKSR